MGFGLTLKFAKRDLSSNKIVVVPYVLSSTIMMGVLFIMVSLLFNRYIKERSQFLPPLISIAIVIVTILTFIFCLYSNNFIMKKDINDLSVYSILGLDKKNVVGIVFMETIILYLMIMFTSTLFGYFFGKVIYLSLNKIFPNMPANVAEYSFSPEAFKVCAILYGVVLFISLFLKTLKISLLSPISLFNSSFKGEKAPKNKYFITFIGFVLMLAGYYIAWSQENVMDSLKMILVAIILVMAGTYILFMTFSIIVLNKLRKNKKYFYKTKNFIFIPNMLSRIKSNSVALASIAIISTGIIVTLATTVAINYSITGIRPYSREYIVLRYYDNDNINLKEEFDKMNDFSKNGLSKGEKIQDKVDYTNYAFMTDYKNGEFTDNSKSKKSVVYVQFYPLDYFNTLYNSNYKIKNNKYLVLNNSNIKLKNQIKILGEDFEIKEVKEKYKGNIGIDSITIVVPSNKDVVNIKKTIGEKANALLILKSEFNIKNDSKEFYQKLEKYNNEKDDVYQIDSKTRLVENLYEMNGGLLFIGIIVGLIFMVGNIIIIYYKQISEAFEDKKDIDIMRDVGLSDEVIKKTNKNQTWWLFMLPLIVALIHSLGCSRIISQLLQIVGLSESFIYLKILGCVGVVFLIVYYIVFKITSKVYFKIIK